MDVADRLLESLYRIDEARGQYVDVKDLPVVLQRALKSVGYNRPNIEVSPAEKVSPAGMGGDGYREFFTIVDLESEKYETSHGSWGGANMFNTGNRVDNDRNMYTIPPNVVTIAGREGGSHPVYAHLYTAPETFTPLLGAGTAEVELTDEEKLVLVSMATLTSAGRKNEYQRSGLAGYDGKPKKALNDALQSLADKGYIQIMGNGSKITTTGKNIAKEFENESYRLSERLSKKYNRY